MPFETSISVKQQQNGMIKKNEYSTLFQTFFKIGTFTLGGGYAMIPLMEHEVVDRHEWMDRKEFLDSVAVAQSTPGVFAVNMSIFVGHKLKGVSGAVAATLATALPSFLIILLIAMCFTHVADNNVVASIFRGIRPAVVALIAVPTWNMALAAKINLSDCWVPLGSALLIWLVGVNPVFILIAAGLGGYLWGKFVQPTE